MEIRSLQDVDIAELVDCFLRSFEGYWVTLPTDVTYWQARFTDSGADFVLSRGVFDGDALMGFVIHCVADEDGHRVAYNTGTGILPACRGQGWVDRLVGDALPALRQAGVDLYRLEVIDQNTRAIRAYERIGLRIRRRLKCYAGPLPDRSPDGIRLDEQPVSWCVDPSRATGPYAWDMSAQTLLRAGDRYRGYVVYRAGAASPVGHFVIDVEKAHVAQLEAPTGDWEGLFAGIQQLVPTVKINNIDDGRVDLIRWLDEAGVPHVIDQYEMEMRLT